MTQSNSSARTLDDKTVAKKGILVDEDILRAVEDGHLIDKSTFDQASVRQASYELHVGDQIEELESLA